MRYGIFSDIHSNLEAMTEVAKAMKAEDAGEYLCLGDLVGYYSNPNEVIELIESLRCWKTVMGNHDSAAVGQTSLSKFNPPAAEAIRWTQQKLKPKNLQMLKSLRLREEIGDIQLVHSSPFQSEEWHYLTQREDIERNFRYFQGTLCFFGHVHKPYIAEQKKGGDVTILEEGEKVLDPNCRYLVNVGSVGQPRDGDPRTCYVIYDSQSRKLSIRRIPYDFETTHQKTIAAGLPEYLAQRLRTGK
jgi:diadenosine tetraphosphatase ApaH/serine/threonine PP2A family protein phosphatase